MASYKNRQKVIFAYCMISSFSFVKVYPIYWTSSFSLRAPTAKLKYDFLLFKYDSLDQASKYAGRMMHDRGEKLLFKSEIHNSLNKS